MIIIISGKAGSGKSTVAKLVATKLGIKRYSSGDFQRELAKERGITIKELGELEAKDPQLDMIVDKKQEVLGQKENDFVMDTWLGAKFIPHSIKVFLDANQDVRAKRIFNDKSNKQRLDSEKLDSFEETKSNMIGREKVNIERWKRYYDFDYTDYQHYDLVINTNDKSVDQVVDEIYQYVLDQAA
jgi:CMP/dCMP kinase